MHDRIKFLHHLLHFGKRFEETLQIHRASCERIPPNAALYLPYVGQYVGLLLQIGAQVSFRLKGIAPIFGYVEL